MGWRSRGDRGLPALLVQLGEQSSSSLPGFPILPAQTFLRLGIRHERFQRVEKQVLKQGCAHRLGRGTFLLLILAAGWPTLSFSKVKSVQRSLNLGFTSHNVIIGCHSDHVDRGFFNKKPVRLRQVAVVAFRVGDFFGKKKCRCQPQKREAYVRCSHVTG